MKPFEKDGYSACLDLHLLMALQYAAHIGEVLGMPAFADLNRKKAKQLQKSVKTVYWDENQQLFSGTNQKKHFSQHTNIFAILTGTVTGDAAKTRMNKILNNTSLIQGTLYFKHFKFEALNKSGLVNTNRNNYRLCK